MYIYVDCMVRSCTFMYMNSTTNDCIDDQRVSIRVSRETHKKIDRVRKMLPATPSIKSTVDFLADFYLESRKSRSHTT